MSTESKQVQYLLNAIVKAQPEEINCDEAQELIDQYIDLEIEGEPIPEQLMMIKDHLEWCGCCRQVVEAIKAALSGLEQKS